MVFYTGTEFKAAFGRQAAAAIRMLGPYAAPLCRGCGGECPANARWTTGR